ncbi:MAG TPA: serine/threonine-protein kinase [Polyangiaceae bacterium]|jgi:serine/threonine-protein kinase
MPREGDSFDRYTIESVLGEGGMGVVYRAFDPRLDRRVALKVVRSQRSEDGSRTTASATAALLREARVAAALDHPNAVAIFDVGEVNGEAFIAMELVHGRPLRAFIGEPQVPFSARLRWLHDIARVLAAAHHAGLAHRDVKPENVMVRDDGDVKVLDFGIARRVRADSPGAPRRDGATLSRAGTMIGTPLYMAPEQVRGEPVDGRSDQFSWAVVAYELLSGKLPWPVGTSEYETLSAIVHDEPPPLRSIAPGVPAVVSEVVARAMKKSPAERFPTMDSLVHILDPVLGPSTEKLLPHLAPTTDPMLPFLRTVTTGEEPSYAPPPPSTPKPEPAPAKPRRRMLLWGAGAFGAAVIVALGALGISRARLAPAAVVPTSAAASVSPPAAPANAAAASAYAMAIQARREGMTSVASDLFKHVLELDPSFAPAVLRLALLDYGTNDSLREARDLFQRATVMRGALSERENALLDALSPCVVQYDMARGECEERLQAAAVRFPDDLEILRELAGQQTFADKLEPAIATCRRALALDPAYVYFAGLMGELQAYAGHTQEALETLDGCTKLRPSATGCIENRIAIRVQQAECTAVESDARNWVSAAPRDGGRWGPQHYLASAQLALGRPLDAVKETLAQEWAKTPADARVETEAIDRAMLAVWTGDFAAAEEQLGVLDKIAAGEEVEDAHALPASLRVQLDEEEGRAADAATVAGSFLDRRESWTRDTRADDWEIAKDVTMRMNDALRRAGSISAAEFAARRQLWQGRWAQTKVARYAWFPAYLYWVASKDEAREALDAVPPEGLPPFRPFVYAEASLGRAHLLVNDAPSAIPFLEKAARGCFALEDPFTTVRAHLWLGQAHEQLGTEGDHDAACRAYGFVLAHWGASKPRSVSAEEAKKRSLALHCPPPAPQR